jgi:hypothetical protein
MAEDQASGRSDVTGPAAIDHLQIPSDATWEPAAREGRSPECTGPPASLTIASAMRLPTMTRTPLQGPVAGMSGRSQQKDRTHV